MKTTYLFLQPPLTAGLLAADPAMAVEGSSTVGKVKRPGQTAKFNQQMTDFFTALKKPKMCDSASRASEVVLPGGLQRPPADQQLVLRPRPLVRPVLEFTVFVHFHHDV
jgi:hypothetical protein